MHLSKTLRFAAAIAAIAGFWLAAATVACGAPITLVAAGDLLLGGSAAPMLAKKGFDYPFDATRSVLESADLAVANLEAPITDSEEEFLEKTYRFKVPKGAAAAIKRAGFDVMTLANNHMADFGASGIADTLDALKVAGLQHAGAGSDLTEARRAAVVEAGGEKIAFLAYSNTFPKAFWAAKGKAGTAPGFPALVRRDIARAVKAADYVVVSFHWGAERMRQPKDYQRELARLAIDSGAQVVLGHHPHVLQGVESYRKGVIFYSLGNFAFGSYSKNARTSILARITLEDGKVLKSEMLPINVYNNEVHFQPRPLAGEQAAAVIAEMEENCRPLGLTVATGNDSDFLSFVPIPAVAETASSR